MFVIQCGILLPRVGIQNGIFLYYLELSYKVAYSKFRVVIQSGILQVQGCPTKWYTLSKCIIKNGILLAGVVKQSDILLPRVVIQIGILLLRIVIQSGILLPRLSSKLHTL